MNPKATLLVPSRNLLGEGPFWYNTHKSLLWVDILEKKILSYDWVNSSFREINISHRPSLIVENELNQLLLGVQGGLCWFDPGTGDLQWICDLEKDIPPNRTNDGAVDANGRLWIGTMEMDLAPGAGSLYCVEKDFRVVKKLSPVSISNGLTWSADNRRMYYIDSPTGCVQSFFFDPEKGNIHFEKRSIEIPEKWGQPDGMAMDEEGMLWIAVWGGFGVYRFDPLSGKHIGTIEVPAPQVSSCCFAGEKLDKLVITTASENMPAAELKKYPESGSLFIAEPGVKGRRVNRFGG